MHWLAKATSLKTLSAVPGGQWLYRLGQEKLTRSLEATRERIAQKIEVGLQYLTWLEKRGEVRCLVEGTHLDFGAGWHPTIPLLYYSLGVERQILCDLRPLLKAKSVAQTVTAFRSIVSGPEWAHRFQFRPLADAEVLTGEPLGDWLKSMGMSYFAPYESQLAKLAGSVDVVTCTQVLYYVQRSSMPGCLSQIRSVLKPGGKFLATIRLTTPDLGGLSNYGHMKFSPETWQRYFNSSLLSYNLFKPPDYQQALQDAGFKVVHFEINRPTAEDWADLAKVTKHPYFDRYKPDDLVGKQLFFAAEK